MAVTSAPDYFISTHHCSLPAPVSSDTRHKIMGLAELLWRLAELLSTLYHHRILTYVEHKTLYRMHEIIALVLMGQKHWWMKAF